jgi:hypothetical protein
MASASALRSFGETDLRSSGSLDDEEEVCTTVHVTQLTARGVAIDGTEVL